MTTVIAERALGLDEDESGFIRIYAPERAGKYWTCEFHLKWPGFEQRQKAGGADSYQAIVEALRGAPLYISRTDAYRAGRLRCMGAVLSAPPKRDPENPTLKAMFDAKWIPGDQP